MQFLKFITLNEEFAFDGSVNELTELLDNPKGRRFHFEWTSETEFKFASKFSLGTMMGGFVGTSNSIRGKGIIESTNLKGHVIIQIGTKVMFELYLIAVVLIILLVGFSFSDESIPKGISPLIPVFLLWIWFVYRIQEKYLFYRFKKHLGIKSL